MSFRQKSSEYSSILASEAITLFAAKAERMQCAPIRERPGKAAEMRSMAK
jgi:hypothetical protein